MNPISTVWVFFVFLHTKVGQSHLSHQPIPYLYSNISSGFVFSTDGLKSTIWCISI